MEKEAASLEIEAYNKGCPHNNVDVLQALADKASVALENLDLYEQLKRYRNLEERAQEENQHQRDSSEHTFDS